MRRVRYALWGLCVVLAVFLTGLVVMGLAGAPERSGAVRIGVPDIGGPFEMVDSAGRRVTEEALLGKPSVIFFGFTFCPEVCPTTLYELSGLMEELGPAADALNVVFVSVDPQRDTPEHLRDYLSSFDPRIVGLTGTPEQLETIAKAYHVYYKRVPTDGGGYTMDHTATVYLMDAEGMFAGTIAYGEERGPALVKVKRLVERAS